MNVSFGQKIPIALAQIQNKKTGKFEQATIFEVDCKDKSDYSDVQKDKVGWHFPMEMAENMRCKYVGLSQYGVDNDSLFYILQNQNNETLGRVQIDKKDDEIYTVEWLDTKANSGYRYVGQTILACAGKEVIDKNGSTLGVLGAVKEAIPFYEDVCQFQDIGNHRFYMEKDEIEEFITRTEQRTQGSLIDLKG